MSYVQCTGCRTHSQGYDNDIVAEHDTEIHDTSLGFYITPTSVSHVSFTLELHGD